MNKSFAPATVSRKVDRTSYTPQASLPMMTPISPAALAAEIKALLASSKELGRRQDALMASLRKPLPPISGGAPEAEDRRIDEMYEHVAWLDHVEAIGYHPADELL
jgi:hypothetical protein